MPVILVIDDSESHRAALTRAIEAAGLATVLSASDGIEGLKLLLSSEVDLVICDVEMPGLDGGKLIPMSQSAQGRPIPFVMLTGVQDPQRRARLFLEGARDVVAKPYHPEELIARLRTHLELLSLQQELVRKNRQLEQLSTIDGLTGLANRRHLEDRLRAEWKRARRYGTPFSVVMIDVDRFKRVNDRHGHQAGDHVLCSVARMLSARLRATDVGGRYGGEEFLMLLASDRDGALVVAERWRADLESHPMQLPDGNAIAVTLSAGVATATEGHENPEQLVAQADAALYLAKQRGRNQVVFADDEA